MKGKKASSLIALCAAVYFCSYLTRQNYATVLVEIIESEGVSKAAASAAITGMFITYGLGQIISGYLGDRLNSCHLIAAGLAATGVLNILIPYCKSTQMIAVVWCCNGLAQSFFWPPLVKILTINLSGKMYQRYVAVISWSSYLATAVLYLVCPALIQHSGWRSVFYICGVVAFVMLVVWQRGTKNIQSSMGLPADRKVHGSSAEKSDRTVISQPIWLILVFAVAAIIMQGMIRDGMTTWLPTYISEQFHIENSNSILYGVLAPLLSVIALIIAEKVQDKLVHNEVACAAGSFVLAIVCCLGVRMTMAGLPRFSIILYAAVIGCAHAANLFLIAVLPGRFRNTGHVSLISGVLNCATYVGSAGSTALMAMTTEHSGWNVPIIIWAAAAFAGFVFCILILRRWPAQFK